MDTMEIEAQAQELDNALDEFQEAVFNIDRISNTFREEKIYHCMELAQHIKTIRDAYKLEITTLTDANAIAKYKTLYNEKNAHFDQLMQSLKTKKHRINKERFLSEAEGLDDNNTEVLNTQEVVSHGDKIQDKTQEAIDRMKRITAETEQTGLATVVKLDNQLEQMGHINQEFTMIESSLKRAQVTARILAKNAGSDRCVQILVVSIIICIVVIIALIATKR